MGQLWSYVRLLYVDVRPISAHRHIRRRDYDDCVAETGVRSVEGSFR